MDLLANNEEKIYGAIRIDSPHEFASPFAGELFPCLIWDHDGRFTDSERSALAKRLLESGCRYAVFGGLNCEAWHDAIDIEFVSQHLDEPEQVRDSLHVMTTWHESESPDEVAFFFVLNTNFDDHDFVRFLVLHIGHSQTVGQVEGAVRKYALGGSAA